MYILGVAGGLLRVLLPFAVSLTLYLYSYPVFHGCVFPARDASTTTAFAYTLQQHWPFTHALDAPALPSVPFRLLVLADPQLEGDSSLPKPEDAFLRKIERRWATICATGGHDFKSQILEDVRGILLEDIPTSLQALRKRLDLLGNDYYLGHIYRTLHWWTKPSHVTVLGDLIGSQWVTDEEFAWRGWRYWNRVFASGHRISDDITSSNIKKEEQIFEANDDSWMTNIINIAGNHDVGYAGEISQSRMDRFERAFGKANWDVRFQYPYHGISSNETIPTIHLIVLNSLILDSPAFSDDLQAETFNFINSLISDRLRPVEDRSSFTLLLTHLPLHKKEGVCIDAPFFDYWGDDDGGGVYRPHGVREQNHLSTEVSQHGTLEALFGMTGNVDAPAQGKGRHGLILTGHDHEGCDVLHYVPSNTTWSSSTGNVEEGRQTTWEAVRWDQVDGRNSHTGVREITLRSMMGDYDGNAGLLSAWYDLSSKGWKYDISRCGLNVKLWWAVHVLDLTALAVFTLWMVDLVARIFFPAGSKHDQHQSSHVLKLKSNHVAAPIATTSVPTNKLNSDTPKANKKSK
ncbi:uncharacterized protein PV06_04711 [Exophiala oligosperma]|uniref:Calcineurin-like phosphoesterase domain-containing protein n=2 Tax=Chaetothyriales TaxID=34395 RepID=A0A0D2AUZ2_9EURO|nr:uncharacterized protein PV06_04711 [Exophiala oligosperma]KAJ9631300.1 hypothetical protein H2204_008242 [Knufia peltigerae]KIW43626.1 hypothetical protein PV06_04711 [Exophiala oligosperma]